LFARVFRVLCFVFRVSCFVFRVSCFVFRVSCFVFSFFRFFVLKMCSTRVDDELRKWRLKSKQKNQLRFIVHLFGFAFAFAFGFAFGLAPAFEFPFDFVPFALLPLFPIGLLLFFSFSRGFSFSSFSTYPGTLVRLGVTCNLSIHSHTFTHSRRAHREKDLLSTCDHQAQCRSFAVQAQQLGHRQTP
jgi:hypothetical protein